MSSTNGTAPHGILVVTGASTGIGRACALDLDARGFTVYAGVRKDADAEALRSAASPRLVPLRIDVTDAASIAAAKAQVEAAAEGKGIAGLVNNAGIGVGGPLEFVELDDLRRQLEVNVTGQIAVTQAFLPMLRQAKGRIVFMGSVSGRLATPFIAPYSASKHALEAIADAFRVELRPWGIGVAIVEPGSIATPIWDKAHVQTNEIEANASEEQRALYGDTLANVRGALLEFQKRGIPPERVAKAVAHALTARRPKTRYLVGADARLQAAMATVAPDRIVDRLVARQLKLP